MLRLSAKKLIYLLLTLSVSAVSLIGSTSTFENIARCLFTGLAAAAVLALVDHLSSTRQIKPLFMSLLGAALSLFYCRLIFSTFMPLSASLSSTHAYYLALTYSITSLLAASWGALVALRSDENLSAFLPFLAQQKDGAMHRDLLLDVSALQDPRIYDIASTGIFDKRLVVAQFVIAEMNAQLPQDDPSKVKLRRSGEIIRNLEELPHLQLKIIEDNQVSIKDSLQRLLSLAHKIKADVITSERYRLQPSTAEDVRIFNLHTLASAFKPLTQSGEIITIKVQRYGKEIKQGVGYLEDNTMVVINGGGDYLGKTIRAQVLSVKHTLSGRMIFCNALSDDHDFESDAEPDDVFNTKTEDENSFI